MRRTLLVAGLCVVGLVAASQPGAALDHGAAAGSYAASDVSAAKKKKQHVYVGRVPQSGYVRRSWMDPSIGPDGRPYPNPYPPNVCSIDLGYGRFGNCDFHD